MVEICLIDVTYWCGTRNLYHSYEFCTFLFLPWSRHFMDIYAIYGPFVYIKGETDCWQLLLKKLIACLEDFLRKDDNGNLNEQTKPLLPRSMFFNIFINLHLCNTLWKWVEICSHREHILAFYIARNKKKYLWNFVSFLFSNKKIQKSS